MEEVRSVLEDDPKQANALRERNDFSPLWLATTWRKDIDMMKVLIAHGADVDCPGTHGHTPLFSAAHLGRQDMVEILLDAGADVNLGTDMGTKPITIARMEGHEIIVKLLTENGAVE